MILSNNEPAIIEDADSISDYAFATFKTISDIEIPEHINFNSFIAFENIEIEAITVSKNHPYLDSRDNCNAINSTKENKMVFATKNTKIPYSVTSIGPLAFYNLKGLKSLYIPSNIRSINYNSFIGLDDLESVEVDKGNGVYSSYNGSNIVGAIKANRVLVGCKNSKIPTNMFTYGNLKDQNTDSKKRKPATISTYPDLPF